jgi:ATP-binding cassette subfamily B protein
LWQRLISNIPQFIFLFDSTIKNNIVFSEPKKLFDKKIFDNVIKIAQLEELINSLPNKYNTKIGERGIKLSGGQRQRIGIARALYRKSEVLIMDEATSALDSQTELIIQSNIHKMRDHLTTITVAHRISTIQSCNVVAYLSNGKIVSAGTFEQVKSEVPDFEEQAQLMGL